MKLAPFASPSGPRLLALAAALLCLIVTIQVAASMNVRLLGPDKALAVVPNDPQILALRADILARGGGDSASYALAQTLARRALNADPTEVAAVRAAALAVARQGDIAKAGKIFSYANTMTKRDLVTHIWFIEENAAKGDVAATLAHYDLALRTSRTAGDQLLPVLVRATADPVLGSAIAVQLARKPAWASAFYDTLVGIDVPPVAVARFARLLQSRRMALPPAVMDRAISNLVVGNRIDDAWALYRSTVGTTEPALIRNAAFERPDRAVPFEWRFPEDGAIAVSRDPADAGNVIAFRAEGGATGEVARQMLILAPGTYHLTSHAIVDQPGWMRLEWNAACVGQQILLARIAASPQGGTLTVPAKGCSALWLTLKLAETADIASGGRISKVILRPVAAR